MIKFEGLPCLTVGELIAKLKPLPADVPVMAWAPGSHMPVAGAFPGAGKDQSPRVLLEINVPESAALSSNAPRQMTPDHERIISAALAMAIRTWAYDAKTMENTGQQSLASQFAKQVAEGRDLLSLIDNGQPI